MTFVRVYSTSRIPDGYLTQGRLEAEGIPVMLKGSGEGPYRMGPVEIWVPQELEIQAREVIEAIANGEFATDTLEDEQPLG